MSRYRIDEPIPASKAAHIYGPDGQVLGKVYRANDPESLRFKRFIEAHDEIIYALLDAAIELHEAGLSVRSRARATNQIDTLIERINSKEAQ